MPPSQSLALFNYPLRREARGYRGLTFHFKRELKMSDFVNRLRELNVDTNTFVTLKYSEGNDVWHINDGYVTDSVHETATAGLLASLLASGIPVYGGWGTPSVGDDILNNLRDNGELDDYERGEDYFEEYITERLAETIYDGEYSLEYSTEQYDYKRGRF